MIFKKNPGIDVDIESKHSIHSNLHLIGDFITFFFKKNPKFQLFSHKYTEAWI